MTTTPTGATLRDAAINAIENAEQAKGDWFAAAYRLVRVIARQNEYFTTDDVWRSARDLGAPQTDPRVMGAVMRQISRDAVAYRTQFTRISTRPCCHCRPISLWCSRIYDPSSI